MIYKNKYMFRLALLLAVLLAGGSATALAEGGVVVHGNVYGGGNKADVETNTEVNMSAGQVNGNVYGGGNLGYVGKVTITEGYRTFTWDEGTGVCNVNITGGTVGSDSPSDKGNVFGAGKGVGDTFWCEKGIVYQANVNISAGTVKGNVYGGGEVGRVETNATVTLGTAEESGEGSKPDIKGSVFGAGAGLETHGYSALVRGNTTVTVQGIAKVGENVYGGGQTASVGRFNVRESLPKEPLSGGTCKVTIQGNAVIGTSGTGEVFGACKGVTPHYVASGDGQSEHMIDTNEKIAFDDENDYLKFLETLALTSNTEVTIAGNSTVNGSVYGGGQRGITLANVKVDMIGGTVNEDVYGGGALANTNTAMWDAEKKKLNDYVQVFGLTPSVSSVKGYYTKSGEDYTKITEETTAVEGTDYYTVYKTAVNLLGGTIDGSAYGGALGRLAKGAVAADPEHGIEAQDAVTAIKAFVYGDTKVNLNGLTVAERNAASSAIQALLVNAAIDGNGDSDNTDADEDYHVVSGRGCAVSRVFGCNDLNGTPKGNVTVHVFATQNKDASKANISAKFVSNKKTDETLADNDATAEELKAILADQIEVAKAISVTTDDYETLYDNDGATEADLKDAIPLLANAIEDAADTDEEIATVNALRYDVRAVYGGGNEAAYIPYQPYTDGTPTGSKTRVIIEGCEYTSIETVYGGGNAAPVPEANVTVNAAYEIGSVFGGGNGKDAKESDGSANPGADIGYYNEGAGNVEYGTGNANTQVSGGYIHELYGGSNEKGTIVGSVNLVARDVENGCEMLVEKMVSAGKNADIMGNAITVLGCMPDSWVEEFYGGADNANVHGNVELTITSGKFRKVFGGNNRGGIINGHLKVNIEETGCRAIEIDELYLGGNQAAYSAYGYYVTNEETAATDGKFTFEPRASEDDAHAAATSFNGVTELVTDGSYTSCDHQPELNVISCTRIGKVFGGGLGAPAMIYGDPTVNINMIQGEYYSRIDATDENPHQLGAIGDVYGGGNEADVIGNPTVNIGTAAEVTLTSGSQTTETVLGAYIVGNVYGGGKGSSDTFACEKAMIGKDGDGEANPDGGTTVNIYKGTVMGNVYGGGEIGRVEKNSVVTIGTGAGGSGTSSPIIKGNVFGGGKGLKTHGYAALLRGNPTVYIQGDAKVEGNVYGGGEIASVARYKVPKTQAEVDAAIAEGYDAVIDMPYALANNTSGYCKVYIKDYAEVGPDGMKMYHADNEGNIAADDKPDDFGHVFAAGKGLLPEVYTYADNANRPKRMLAYDAETIGAITHWEYADDAHRNIWQYFKDEDEYFQFVRTLALASNTDVTISDHAFVKGSVYGGSENGLVQYDTHVYIKDNCQIGQGKEILTRYEDHPSGNLFALTTPPVKSGSGDETVYYDLECAHWDYGKDTNGDGKADQFSPYDPNAIYLNPSDEKYYYDEDFTKSAEGGAKIATDGHTYYGNVFGGGSGSVPYFDTHRGISRYILTAGEVKGNANVTITGGHILTNVYGGCEATDVLGNATITMTGGTLGVPRTLGQILAHPVTCYLFGAGKGDQRIYFNKATNVESVNVAIDGGTIFGSVFGGGEDGHVKRDVAMTIGKAADHTGPSIGNWGTSYVDGNVFGGGRGFGGDAYTAGNVSGSIGMTIHGGTMLGSIYGGGRLGSVGYGLYDESETGKYGTMRPDNFADDGTTPVADFKRGHVDITITGGTIGNDHEYTYNPSEELRNGILRNTTFEDYTFKEKKADGESTTTVTEEAEKTTIKRLLHTRGGNVFVGGMGRRLQLDGVTPITAIDWMKLGAVKSTKLTVTGGHIKSNVYGGGEFGGVIPSMDSDSEPPVFTGGTTEIDIQGGTIGTEIKKDGITQYTFGSVFGGGMGDVTYGGGDVRSNTTVSVVNATVLASVYGGGEMATVQGNSNVTIDGTTTVGLNKVRKDDGYVMYGGSTMGNVYGAGLGSIDNVNAGKVEGNTTITIGETGSPAIYHNVYGGGAYASVGTFDLSTDENKASYYVPVAGIPVNWSAGTGRATLNILGGTIGISGRDNGMVCGSSRGDISNLTTLAVPADPGTPGADPFDKVAWVKESVVNIGDGTTGPIIKGSVYGGGENGHNAGNAMVNVKSGTIGITDTNDPWFTFTDEEVKTKSLNTRGNIYGSGCGTDTYEIVKTYGTGSSATTKTFEYNNPWSGIVRGNTKVNISGGQVTHSVYGGGSMGSVGTITNWEDTLTVAKHQDIRVVDGRDVVYGLGLSWPYKFEYVDTTGTATVTVTGGRIGIDDTNYGDVYGAPRGKAGDRYAVAHLANVRETVVTVNYATTPAYDEVTSSTPYILGSVFGGGADGHVLDSTIVEITGGLIGHSVYGGGKGDGTYEGVLKATTGDHAEYPTTLCDWTSGKIYGNTRVTMRGGHVMRNVYGGGNLGSVGKGNYAGGLDDYYPAGYGETLEAENLWDGSNANSLAFLSSGKTNVTILDGVIGTADGLNAGMPTGSVFGGSRGKAAEDVGSLSPRYEYAPDFFLGYVNEAEVTIGDADHAPIIWASVYGGGRDGHVRRSTHVTVNNGLIGKPYTSGEMTDIQWRERGNVYGSGSGMSTLHGTINDRDEHGTSSGSVTRNAVVDIKGGTIYQNVYGGGALSCVGPPKIGPIADPEKSVTVCRVNVEGGTIGTADGYAAGYGGNVFGAGRGGGLLEGEDETKFATSVWTEVNIMPHASDATKNPVIKGSVFGGGNAGPVLRDTEVLVIGGTINHNVYGGGNVAEVKGHANVTIGQKKATPAPAPAPGREPVPAPAPAP